MPWHVWRERFCLLIVGLEGRFNPQSGILPVTGMAIRSNFGAAKILCVELDVAVLESRGAALKVSGYDVASASPRLAEIVLRSQRLDLIVLSNLSDSDLHRILNFADGADVLVLNGFTMPSELLSSVGQRLKPHQRRA
jgi:hypothetical protein